MIDIHQIFNAINNGDAQTLAELIQQKKIYIKDGAIHVTPAELKSTMEYWDKRQLVRKILLNSALTTAPLASNSH